MAKCNTCNQNIEYVQGNFKREVLGRNKDGTWILGQAIPLEDDPGEK